MQIDGECFCGKIAYRAELVSPEIGLCHCSDCQAFSGSPYRATVTAMERDFSVTRGEARAFVKTGSSGRKSAQYFCDTCGSNLYRIAEGEDRVGIRIGTIRQRHELKPARQTWLQSGLEWSQDLRAVEVTPNS
jgi:hypothetical protein